VNETGPIIGVPQALSYYKHAAMWDVFFNHLGARVEASGPTNKKILEDGLRLAVAESCLPLKVYLGHVHKLIQRKPDYILLFRQQDFAPDNVLCTVFWGLPDICRNLFELPDGCQWLELNISPSIDKIDEYKAYKKVGRTFTINPFHIRSAFLQAVKAQKRYDSWLRNDKAPRDALDLSRKHREPETVKNCIENRIETHDKQVQIGLLGHAYLIHDEHFGIPIIKLLHQMGAKIHIVEDLDKDMCRNIGREVSPNLYWTYNREILGAAEHYLRNGVDGLILLEAFPCGPDALALEYTTRKLRDRAPIMRLVIDELQALTGIQTRLESFIDVLRMRRGEAADV
jgi:predicted nucleotide-binding protein (sugar kinase/HSP70/actin superfamily)